MDYKFELKEQPAQPVLSIRRRTSVDKLPEEIGKAYSEIIKYLDEMGEKPEEAPFVAYYNLDMEDLDVSMGFPVLKQLPGKGDIKAEEIPGGKQVSYMYKGSYNGMAPVYEAMSKWVSENGHVPTGISYEYYYNSPADVPENELLTKIVFPLK